MLSRSIAEKGIYPAVDPLDSTSRILEPRVVGEEHYAGRPPGAADPAEVQVAAGHHRHSRHGRAVGRGQADGRPRPQDRALPVAAVPRCRGLHRLARQARLHSGHHQGLQGLVRRRLRPSAGAGVLHGRHDRRGHRQGREAGRGGLIRRREGWQPHKFGSCCEGLKDVLTNEEFEPLIAVDDSGVLYMSVGMLDAESDEAQHGRSPRLLLPLLRQGPADRGRGGSQGRNRLLARPGYAINGRHVQVRTRYARAHGDLPGREPSGRARRGRANSPCCPATRLSSPPFAPAW